MQKPVLSKSSYIRGLQCLKSLYLYKTQYNQRDALSPEQQAKFKRGTKVGILAQKLFSGGKTAYTGSFKHYMKSVEKTQELIDSGCSIIYEASFIFDDVYVAVDILKKQDNQWVAYEVKSSLSLTQTYYQDASLQYYVITGSGLFLKDFMLIHINPNYVRQGNIVYESLFTDVSVYKEVVEGVEFVKQNIGKMKSILSDSDVPLISIGMHCATPYTCDFTGYCRKQLPLKQTVFNLVDLNLSTQYDFFNKGIVKWIDLPSGYLYTEKQKIQIQNSVYINPSAFKKWLNQNKDNADIFFLDVLTFSSAIPLFNGTAPYQQIPYSFNLLKCDYKGAKISENSYYSEPGFDGREALLIKLFENFIGGEIVVTHDLSWFLQYMDFGMNKFDKEIKNKEVVMNFADLNIIFSEFIYYNPVIKDFKDPIMIFNDMKFQNQIKPDYQSKLLAGEDYQHAFVSNDLFENEEIKEKQTSYIQKRTSCIRDIFFHISRLN